MERSANEKNMKRKDKGGKKNKCFGFFFKIYFQFFTLLIFVNFDMFTVHISKIVITNGINILFCK